MRKWRDQFERLRQRVDDLLRELTGLPRSEPELVPVPVRVRVRPHYEVDRS
jgi:hypothetical protein